MTPPDRIRLDPLRMLMQQLQNDEQGLPQESDIYNVLFNTATNDVTSILLGADGTGPTDSYNFTISNGTPVSRRVGAFRNVDTGDTSALSDLLPGGVDRALQLRCVHLAVFVMFACINATLVSLYCISLYWTVLCCIAFKCILSYSIESNLLLSLYPV